MSIKRMVDDFVLRKCCKSFAMSLDTCIFAMFFMVLDLRLTKVGTQRSPFFCVLTSTFSGLKQHILPFILYFCNPHPI